MRKSGFRVGFIPEAYVYHKRRTSLAQFFKQVSNFGKGRILVGRAHRGEVKLTHWLPALFLVGLLFSVFALLINISLGLWGLALYASYFLAIGILALTNTHSVKVALLSVPASFIQLTGYGFGFFKEKAKTYLPK
jgi:GT2 family glycosyltransferase